MRFMYAFRAQFIERASSLITVGHARSVQYACRERQRSEKNARGDLAGGYVARDVLA